MRITLPTKGAGNIWIDDNSEEAQKIREGYNFHIPEPEEKEEKEKLEATHKLRRKVKVIIDKKGKTDIAETGKKVRNKHQAKLTLKTAKKLEDVKQLLEEIIEALPQVPWDIN